MFILLYLLLFGTFVVIRTMDECCPVQEEVDKFVPIGENLENV